MCSWLIPQTRKIPGVMRAGGGGRKDVRFPEEDGDAALVFEPVASSGLISALTSSKSQKQSPNSLIHTHTPPPFLYQLSSSRIKRLSLKDGSGSRRNQTPLFLGGGGGGRNLISVSQTMSLTRLVTAQNATVSSSGLAAVRPFLKPPKTSDLKELHQHRSVGWGLQLSLRLLALQRMKEKTDG